MVTSSVCRRPHCVTAALLMSMAACAGADDAQPPTAESRDSAGIVITTSFEPRWDAPDVWRLDSVPFLALTGADPAFDFYRVEDATRLADGTLVVLNAGTHEVRFFEGDGTPLRVVGQEGEGPGDFKRLRSVSPFRRDSVFVFDYWLRRATIFDARGTLGRVVTLEGELQTPELLPVSDDKLIARTWSLDAFMELEGAYRGRYLILDVTPEGEIRDTISDLAGWSGYKVNRGGGDYTDFAPLFISDGHVAAGRHGIVMGPGDRMEFRRYSVAGRLERIVRVPVLDGPLSREEVEAERAAMLPPEASARYRRLVESLPAPELRPAYGDLVLDSEGFVWVARYRSPRRQADDPVTWYVFGETGAWLGSLTTPARFTVMEIGPDYVLGTRRDSLDAEHVQMLRLRR